MPRGLERVAGPIGKAIRKVIALGGPSEGEMRQFLDGICERHPFGPAGKRGLVQKLTKGGSPVGSYRTANPICWDK